MISRHLYSVENIKLQLYILIEKLFLLICLLALTAYF